MNSPPSPDSLNSPPKSRFASQPSKSNLNSPPSSPALSLPSNFNNSPPSSPSPALPSNSTPFQSTEKLRIAASNGDVGFLKDCISSDQPPNFWLTQFPQHKNGNIIHLAILGIKQEFIREAFAMLPPEIIQTLILQPNQDMKNPLHLAASQGNLQILKLLINAFISNSLPSQQPKPWLQQCSEGSTPCHAACLNRHEDCGLELLELDMESLSNVHNNRGAGILYLAIIKGLNKIALRILNSPYSFSTHGIDYFKPLHMVSYFPGKREDICRLLLEKYPEQLQHITESEISVINKWARVGKFWPFECLLRSNDIIPDVPRIFVGLLSHYDKYNANPLHRLASHPPSENDDNLVNIVRLCIDAYKQEAAGPASSSSISEDQLPWIMPDKQGATPLEVALRSRNEKVALCIISESKNALKRCQKNAMILAIYTKCFAVAEIILDIVDKEEWTTLLTDDADKRNVLHVAPSSKKEFCKRLLEKYPFLLEGVDKNKGTILHSWALHGQVWPFKLLFEGIEIDQKWKSYLARNVVSAMDYNLNNPFHTAANSSNEETSQVVKLLAEVYKEENCSWRTKGVDTLPWFAKNIDDNGPLHMAMSKQRQQLALTFLSLYEAPFINGLLNIYKPEHRTLFLAMENKCYEVAKELITRLAPQSQQNLIKYITDPDDGRNVMHLSPRVADEGFGRWLIGHLPNLILKPDNNEKTPLDEASNVGAVWCIQEMLKKDPSVYSEAPLAWIQACENGHVSAIRAFIDGCPGNFKYHCRKHKDTPLHHIQLPNLMEYEEFLKIPKMKDFINVQDSEGETPLHKAIRSQNIQLAETLLSADKIMDNIKDCENETARGLLVEACKQHQNWAEMCRSIEYDPTITTSYFKQDTNQLDVRNTLSVVAALLATITFTAGFTLPGGFTQDKGEAILSKKAAFLVFLISDTLAMCLSMLVLICLIWSMVYDSNKSLVLIDRSMKLLILALYSTLLAFVAGVFAVISHQSMWAAILIIVMCSVIFISAKRNLLYKVVDNLIPSSSTEHGNRFSLMEMGKACLCRGGSSCVQCM